MYIETGIQLYMYMLLRYKLGYGLQKELAFSLHDSSIIIKKIINLTKLMHGELCMIQTCQVHIHLMVIMLTYILNNEANLLYF